MMFVERKAFIEYLDSDKVRITTPLRQKEFELKKIEEDQIIDLINLKTVKATRDTDKFVAILDSHEGSISLEIYVNGRKNIGCIAFGESARLFKSKILEND